MLPALAHRTVLPQFPLVGLCPPWLEQLVKLSASMSTTATKHLPGCVHKAGLSFAKIPNWDGLSRKMSEPKWTKSKLRQTFQRLSSTTEGEAKIGQPPHNLSWETINNRTYSANCAEYVLFMIHHRNSSSAASTCAIFFTFGSA